MNKKASLIRQIDKLRHSEIGSIVNERLSEFNSMKNKKNDLWFSELSFCILTANSKAKTAIAVQKELGFKGFCKASHLELSQCIRKNKHRFHNNKSRYIIEARRHIDIKKKILSIIGLEGEFVARAWLAKNIKGLGFKEASHFLRNIGYTNLAVLDRHVLNLLFEHGYLKQKPKTLVEKSYLEIEKILARICKQLKVSQAELDLYLWYMKTKEVLK